MLGLVSRGEGGTSVLTFLVDGLTSDALEVVVLLPRVDVVRWLTETTDCRDACSSLGVSMARVFNS